MIESLKQIKNLGIMKSLLLIFRFQCSKIFWYYFGKIFEKQNNFLIIFFFFFGENQHLLYCQIANLW